MAEYSSSLPPCVEETRESYLFCIVQELIMTEYSPSLPPCAVYGYEVVADTGVHHHLRDVHGVRARVQHQGVGGITHLGQFWEPAQNTME